MTVFLAGILPASAAFKDIKLDLTNGNLLTQEEIDGGSTVEFGVAIGDDGTATRVAADAATANIVLRGKYHSNEHGWGNFSATVPVEGPVKVSMGTCNWGGDVTIKDGEGNTIGTFNTANGTCYHNDKANNIVSGYYKGTQATTLTVSGGSYTPYFAVESVDPADLTSDIKISYQLGNAQAEGTVPDAETVEAGAKYTLPRNFTLYAEGKTLTGWTDGTNTYKPGEEITAGDNNMELTAVFTDNTVSLSDRKEAVTLNFDFQRKNGAPTVGYENVTGIWVTQAVVNGETIDVKLDFDTNNGGKIANGGWTDWAQMNGGTKLTVPSCKGATVSLEAYSTITTTTIDGQDDYTQGTTVSYTIASSTNTIDIVIGNGSYYRYVKVTLPASTGDKPVTGGITYENVSGNVSWPVGNEESGTVSADIDGTVQYATVTTGDGLNVEQAEYFETQMMKYTPSTSNAGNINSVMIEYRVKMADGLTFQPTSVSYDAVKVGTDGATFATSYTLDGVEQTITDVDAKTVLRNNGANASTAQLNHNVDITADAVNDFTFRFYISKTANNKNIAIGNVVVSGLVNGTKEVQTITLTDEAASVIWDFNSTESYETSTVTPDNGFSVVSVNIGDIELTGTGTGQAKNDAGEDVTFIKCKPSGSTTAIEWFAKPAAGLTFTPTKVSAYIQRFGTDAENGVTVTAKLADGTEETLGNFTAPRNNKTQAEDKYGSSSNYTNRFVIELTEAQQQTLTSADGFYLYATVGVGNTKEGGFSDVRIEGLLNGTMVDITKYTLTTKTNPEGAGEISVYPKADEYEAGEEVQITTTPNFGYHFINWTDAEGNEVSTEAKFKYTIDDNVELTANYEAVNTYELSYGVEGGANLYMVQPTPAPTVIDGKNMYEEGTVVTLTASSNQILEFTNWSTGETFSETKLTMDGDKAITATYSAIDYIVGWDFYTKGNNGRPADFASTADNESATLILRDADGDIQGWLDKSTLAAGGYESLTGAAVNWKKLGQYYYQTKINARDFTDITVKATMLFNYNVYTKQIVEYSLDGENWNKCDSIVLDGPKVQNTLNSKLPAEADHAENLYLRWRPDLTSEVKGTEAADNDGTAIANIFILGDRLVFDDGTAPVLVSTVPENNATGASSSGKIVLNFDEKVKLTDNAKATLGDEELKLNVSGMTVTAAYKNLEYATDYVFTLAAGSVSDITDNIMTEAVTIKFTTMTRPEIAKGMYDKEVTTVEEFLSALEEANTRADKDSRYRIFLHNGTYDLGNATLTTISANNISLIGESEDEVIITNTPEEEGIGVTATLFNSSTGLYLQDITLKNAYPYDGSTGRAVCLQDKGNKTIAKYVKLLSFQDTYYSNKNTSRYYWEDSEIHGTVDFLCGGGDVYYNRVNLVLENRSGNCIAAPSGELKYGYVFLDCEINCVDGAEGTVNGSFNLGRPWGANARAQYINTRMNVLPTASGWTEMGGNKPMVFAEYNSTDKNGNQIDLTSRKTKFDGGEQASAILTEAQVEELSIANVMGSTDDWDPLTYTEQAPVPTNVSLNGTTLTWDDSNYVLLWAICKDGKVTGFTTESTYTVDGTDATWSVRAANEMGGLGEAATAGISTGISTINATGNNVVNTDYYNMQGIKVGKSYKGTVIRVETLDNGKTVTSKLNK